MSNYKIQKEAFVSDNLGASLTSINLTSLTALVSVHSRVSVWYSYIRTDILYIICCRIALFTTKPYLGLCYLHSTAFTGYNDLCDSSNPLEQLDTGRRSYSLCFQAQWTGVKRQAVDWTQRIRFEGEGEDTVPFDISRTYDGHDRYLHPCG